MAGLAPMVGRLRGRAAEWASGFVANMKAGTPPFAPFEWLLAGRYLRARRRGGGVSVVAFFSVLGIALGVATLIIVLSVMNGFRAELLSKIVGINGHLFATPIDRSFTDWQDLSDRLSKVAGVKAAVPLVEGQAFASSQYGGSGVLVRGIRAQDLDSLAAVTTSVRAARWKASMTAAAC